MANLDQIEVIARACHEANRVLQSALNEEVSKPWQTSSEEIRESARNGVVLALQGSTPEELHEGWVEFKVSEGYKWGPVKSETSKTHPCLVSYEELPEEQKVKDKLFYSIVDALKGLKVEAK